jgi:CheY-like chemotaxis protein
MEVSEPARHALVAVPPERARSFYEALRRAGFVVSASTSGGDALRAMAERPDLAVLVTHTRLPTVGGLELALHFLARSPAGRVVLVCEGSVEEPGADDPRLRVVVEPVDRDVLVAAATDAQPPA